MKNTLWKIYVALQILKDEKGQDLVEYALVIALVALAATAGMGTLAGDLNTAFGNLGSKLTSYIT